MSDRSRGEPAVGLERPVGIRRSWLRRLVRLAIVCLGVAIVAGISDVRLLDRGRECLAAVHAEHRDAVAVCQRAYNDARDAAIGVLLARAQYEANDKTAAAQLARQLLSTPQRSDALQILGQVARDDENYDDAATALEEARRLHRLEHKPREIAIDDWLLALIRTKCNQFADALQLVDECIKQAQLADDTTMKRRGHLTAAKILIRVGYWLAAEYEFDLASQFVTTNLGRADLEYQRASLYQEWARHDRASVHFEKALEYDEGSPDASWRRNTELNLAYSLAEQGQITDAQHHLDEATLLDSVNGKEPERTWVAARIAYRRHDLASAASLTDKYFQLRSVDTSEDRDNQIDVASLRARVELDRDNLDSARRWAQRGIDQAEFVRGVQSVLELRPWVLAKRREPYELLFIALARSHNAEAAAMVFDQWQGRAVQDALVRSQPPASLNYRDMADHITKLGAWLGVASQAPFARNPDPDIVLRTMHDIDLLALIVADNTVWRLTANHGPPELTPLGSFDAIKELVEQFLGRPTDVQAASTLAARLLPDDVFRTTRESLQVIVDGRLPPLPVAALRRRGTPLVALRPIARMLRLPETPCAHVTRSGPATVLGDPEGNLPSARVEAEQVARLLHTTGQIGATATKAALRSAAHDAVLHVAAHGEIGIDGAALVLADGQVSALEISAARVAPSLAVLSACHGALAGEYDVELAGSLVAGFLGAGSQHVVATLSAITDASAPEIITQFYRAGGIADPVRALEVVQGSLAKTGNVDWPYFAVFGPDVCPEDASRPR